MKFRQCSKGVYSEGVFYDLFLYIKFNMLGAFSLLNITIKNDKCVDHWQPMCRLLAAMLIVLHSSTNLL